MVIELIFTRSRRPCILFGYYKKRFLNGARLIVNEGRYRNLPVFVSASLRLYFMYNHLLHSVSRLVYKRKYLFSTESNVPIGKPIVIVFEPAYGRSCSICSQKTKKIGNKSISRADIEAPT